MKPLRVALVHPYHWDEVRRGGERYLSDLTHYLRGAGHSVEVIVTRGPDARPGDLGVRRARRFTHPLLSRRGIGVDETLAFTALPALARRRFDVVHSLVPWPVLTARAAGQRVVYTEIGHPTTEWRADQPGGLRLYRGVVRAAAEVTALSESAAQATFEVGGRRATVLAPGVRLDRFAAKSEPVTVPRLLFVSDASERRKGLDLAVGAVARLLRSIPDLELLLGGPGDHTWALEGHGEAAAAVRSAGLVPPDDLPRVYREAAVTLLPSTHEAFGLVLIESLACGTPVVATDTGGMREIVTPEVGRTFPAGDVDALAGAIRAALALAREESTVTSCRERARLWDWAERIGPAHEEIYSRVARS